MRTGLLAQVREGVIAGVFISSLFCVIQKTRVSS